MADNFLDGLKNMSLKELDSLTGLPVSQPAFTQDPNRLAINPSAYDTNGAVPNQNAYEYYQQMRSENQPWSHQAFNGIVGGALSGAATAVEDISYLPNVVTQFFDNDYETNALAETMQGIKETIGTEMPIYRQGNGVFSWDDGAVVWDSIKGILDSAIGFGLPGIGIAGGISKGVSKASKLFKALEKSTALQQAVTSVGSGLIMNDLEGTMMGVELYSNLLEQGVSKEEAAQKATEFKKLNRLFAVTDALQVHGLFKGVLPGGTRNSLNARGIFKNLGKFNTDDLAFQGLKEFGEEVGQNVIQSEKEYEGLLEAGKIKEAQEISTKDDIFDRVLDLSTSDKALYEGMLGFFGGGPQRILGDLLAGNYKKENRDSYDKAYNEQQELIKQTNETINSAVNNFVETTKLINEAENKGADDLVQTVKDSQFTQLLIKNFAAGTAQNLETQLTGITELTPEKAAENGLTPTYKEDAQKALLELNKSEKQWNRLVGMPNKEEVFFNIKKGEFLTKQRTASTNKLISAEMQANSALNRIASREIEKAIESKGLPQDISLGVNITLDTLDNNTYENPVQKKAFNQAVNYFKKTKSYKDYLQAKDELKLVDEKLESNDKEYTEITSKEYQTKTYPLKLAVKQLEKNIKQSEEAAKQKEQGIANITSIKSLEDFTATIEAATDISDNQKQTLLKKANKAYTDKLNAERASAPKVTDSLDSLDARYEGRPTLLEHELLQASQKEGVEFATLAEYKEYLKKNAKTTDDTTAKDSETSTKEGTITTVPITNKVLAGEASNTESPNSEDFIAIVNDMAFFEFDKIVRDLEGNLDEENSKITILNLTGAREKYTVRGFKDKYSLTEPLNEVVEGKPYTLKDKDNNPIPSRYVASEAIDLNYLRDGKLKKYDEVVYEVNKDYILNELPKKMKTTITSDNAEILIVKYDADGRHVIGLLPAWKEGSSNDLRTLRDSIFEGVVDSSTTGIYQFPIKVQIKEVWSGKFWNTGTWNNPKSVLKENEPFILGIGAKREDGKIHIIQGFTNDEGTKQLKTPDGEPIQIVEDSESNIHITPGAVYQIIKAPNNVWKAYRVQTSRVSDVDNYNDFKAELLQILDDIYTGKKAYDEYKPIIDRFYTKFEFTFTPDRGFNFQPKDSELVVKLSPQELYDLADIDNQFVSITGYSGNTPFLGADVQLPNGETVNYNDWIAEQGYVKTDLNPLQHFHSQKFTIYPYRPVTLSATQFDAKAPEKTPEQFASELEKSSVVLSEKIEQQLSKEIAFSLRVATPEDLGKSNEPSGFDMKFKEATTSKPWNKEKELTWFKQRFPNVPITVLDDLRRIHNQGGVNAHGLFYNAAVYIAEHAGEGTTYHEAFHVVFNMFLDEKEQANILQEARKSLGYKGTDLEVEEKLADKFMEQVLTNESPKGLVNKIKAFFNKLWNFIKFDILNVNDINTLFYSIESNKFFNYPRFKRDVSNVAPRFKATKTLTPFEEEKTIQMFRANIRNVLELRRTYPENKYLSNKKFYEKQFDLGSSDNVIVKAYKDFYKQYYGTKVDMLSGNPELKQKVDDVLTSILTVNDGVIQYNPLTEKITRSFREIGIKLNYKYDSSEVENDEENGQVITGENFDKAHYQEDPMDRVSDRIKMWFDTLPNITKWSTDPSKIEYTTNIFGYVDSLPTDYAKNYMLDNYSGSLNVQNMMDKLAADADKAPWLNKAIKDLNANPDLKTDLFQYLQNIKTSFLFLSSKTDNKSKETKFVVSNSNSQGIVRNIISNWNSGFNSSLNILMSDGKINTAKAKAIYNRLLTIKDNSPESIELLFNTLSYTGMTVPMSALNNLAGNKKAYTAFVNSFKNFYSLVQQNKNPFDNTDTQDVDNDEVTNNTKSGSAILYNMASSIKKVNESYYQGVHINVEGNKVYNHIRSSFMGRMVNMLTQKDKESRDAFIRKYTSTAFYKNSPFLNSLLGNNNNWELLSFNIFDGLKRTGQDIGTKYQDMSEAELNIATINLWFNNAKDSAYYGYPVLSDTSNLVLLGWKKYTTEQALEDLYKTALQEWDRISLDTKPNIKNFKDKSNDFVLFKFLNGYKGLFNNPVANKQKIKNAIALELDRWFDGKDKSGKPLKTSFISQLKDLGIIESVESTLVIKDKQLDSRLSADLDKKLKQYFYSDVLMQSQFAITFSGDVAFYKNIEDFYKRNKQVWSPGTFLDVTRLEGKTSYRVKVLKDDESPSKFKDAIEEALVKAGYNEGLAKKIASQYDDVNKTDAQAYIDIVEYRLRQKGLARWSDREEQAYNNIINNTFNPSDLSIIFQPLKPFVFTHQFRDNLVVPLQMKNSELLLLPQMAEKSKELKAIMKDFGYSFKGNKYQGYNEANRNTDEIMFESAVKVGLTEPKTVDEISKIIPYLVDYSDYRIQQETPEHHLDSSNLFGTQERKLILGDLNYDAEYTLPDGTTIKGADLINEFNLTLNNEIKSVFAELQKQLNPNNYKELVDRIKQQMIDDGMPESYLEALEFTNGDTVLPLYHPLIYYKVETLLNSIVRKQGTKLKFNGGSFYNASSFGLDDKLDVKFNSDGSLKYFEVMMPAWSEDFVKYLADENGFIDIKKLEEAGLDTGLVYRIPTENKYSMFRIKVKGFTPAISGGHIIMPDLITKIAGLDFDIDKVYAMLYNFKVVNNTIKRVENGQTSKEARQNYLLDLMSAVLTNTNTLRQQVTPGGYPSLTKLVAQFKEYTGSEEELGYFSPMTRTEIFNRNMTGKNNIGIFANINSTHQLFQHAKQFLGFAEEKEIKFDSKERRDLRTFKDVNGERYVTDNIAEFLASAVDNAKDPIASYLNINEFTADLIGMIVSVGYPIDTAISFVNQPVIRKLTTLYFNSVGSNEDVLIKQVFDDFSGKVGETVGSYEAIGEVFNFNTKELKEQIKFTNNIEGRSKDFYRYQLRVLKTFMTYKKQAKNFADLVRAAKVADAGPGPTFAETISKIRTIRKLNRPSYTQVLEGATEFFSEDTPANNLYKKFIKQATEQFFANDKVTYVFNDAVQDIIDEFEELKEYDLTANEIEQIQRNLITFISTGFSEYSHEDSKKVLNKTPKQLMEYKTKMVGKSKYDGFLAYLTVVPNQNRQTKGELPFLIEFDNNTASNSYTQEVISKTWEEMMYNGDNEERELAQNLQRYTFYSAGFNFAPNSFYHISPVKFFRSLTDSKGKTFDSYFNQKIEETKTPLYDEFETNTLRTRITTPGLEYLTNFKEQYIRNYFKKLPFIKKAIYTKEQSNVSKVLYSEYKGTEPTFNAEPIEIIIGADIIPSTNLVKREGKQVVPLQYIKHTYNGKQYLFKFVSESSDGSILYSRLEPLGYKSKNIGALEFDLNSDFLETKWQFNKIGKSKDILDKIVEDEGIDLTQIGNAIDISGSLQTVDLNQFMNKDNKDQDKFC